MASEHIGLRKTIATGGDEQIQKKGTREEQRHVFKFEYRIRVTHTFMA